MGIGDLRVAEARQYEELHQIVLNACSVALRAESDRANCSGLVKTVVLIFLRKTGQFEIRLELISVGN
jgi:hypothetical protein